MSQPRPRSGPSVATMIISILLVIVGFLTIEVGFASYQSQPDIATLYFTVGFLSLGLVLFSVLRVRRGVMITRGTPNKVLSIILCPQCSFKQLKNFAVGDYVFKTQGKCSQCGVGSLYINGIYTEGPSRR